MHAHPSLFSILGLLVVAPSARAASAGGDPAPFPLVRGEVVATYCPNSRSAAGNSLILVDPRTPGPIGSNWLAPFFSNESGLAAEQWNYANLGCVFGIAVDSTPDIYVSASSSYGNFGTASSSTGGTYGPAGGGGVYRIDGVTGDIDSWMVTGTGAVGTNTLLNPAGPGQTPPGLGDICYDDVFDQFFVSDFADGRIYQVKKGSGSLANKGVVQHVYDPFLPYPYAGNPLFAPLGERVWAVHVTNVWRFARGGSGSSSGGTIKRALLFSVWLRDQTRQTTPWPASWPLHLGPDNNAIFQWDLDALGNLVSSGPTLWGVMPYLVDGDGFNFGFSCPVSDITTAPSATAKKPMRLLAAERTMIGDYGALGHGHFSRLLAFRLLYKLVVSSTWPPQPNPDTFDYHVGDLVTSDTTPLGWNSCGGTTTWRYSSGLVSAALTWSTGDALLGYDPFGNPPYAYGLQCIPGNGNQYLAAPQSSTSLIIDLDHDVNVADKSQPGDVEYITRSAH